MAAKALYGDLTEQALTGVLAITNEVLAGGGCLVDNSAVETDVLISVLGVSTGTSTNSDGGGRLSGGGVLLEVANVRGERGDGTCGGDVARNSVESGVDYHVVEKVSKLLISP